MKVTYEKSPYGDEGVTYNNELEWCKHFILQLESFRSPDKTSEEAADLEADIAGYKAVLRSGSTKNAAEFFEIKDLVRRRKIDAMLITNLDVIDYLRMVGRWEE